VHVLGYEMITLEDGWKINAVKVQDVPEGMAWLGRFSAPAPA
jgi:hypothetical protein